MSMLKRCGFRRCRGWTAVLATAMVLASASAQDSPAERTLQEAAAWLRVCREAMNAAPAFRSRGTFRHVRTGTPGREETLCFEAATRSDGITAFSLRRSTEASAPVLRALKGRRAGVLEWGATAEWVEFSRVPEAVFREQVQTPGELLDGVFGGVTSAEFSGSPESLGGRACLSGVLALDEGVVRSVAGRLSLPLERVDVAGSRASATLWITEDRRLCRLAMRVSVMSHVPESAPEGAEGFSSPPGPGSVVENEEEGRRLVESAMKGIVIDEVEATVDFFGYGEAVEIDVPPEIIEKIR